MTVLLNVPLQFFNIVLDCLWEQRVFSANVVRIKKLSSQNPKDMNMSKTTTPSDAGDFSQGQTGAGNSPVKGSRSAGAVNLATLAVMAVLGVTPHPAHADASNGAERVSLTVRHINAHPKTVAEAQQTLHRLEDAALEVCGASGFSASAVKKATRASRCYRDALADAITRIDNTELSQAFLARGGHHTRPSVTETHDAH